jgi:ABC-type uncharacterized transport system permease subunit
MNETAHSVVRRAGSIALSVAVTLAVLSVVILLMGSSPLDAAAALWVGAFGSPFTIGQTLTIGGILVLTGLASAIPFSARLFNVGGEGQLFAGAIGSVTVALTMGVHPLTLPIALVVGAASGVIWALIPGAMRAFLGASEMIVSLLMNFVAALAADYVIRHVFPDTSGQATVLVDRDVRLPVLWAAGGVNVGILLCIVFAIVAWVVMSHTRLGFGMRAVGLNDAAAELAGFSRTRLTMASFAMAGAAAGLAGALLVMGNIGQLAAGMSSGYGFLGVIVALLAGLRAGWIPLSAVLIAALTVGSNRLQVAAGLPFSLGVVVLGVLVLTLLATRVITLRRS